MFNKGADGEVRPKTPFVPDGTMALRSLSLDDVIFVNVEGVPELADSSYLTPAMMKYWDSVSAPMRTDGRSASDAYALAGQFAEFGKVACITAGVIRHKDDCDSPYFITTSYAGDDEREILGQFADMVNNFFSGRSGLHYLCGHGIWQYDIPFVAKRMLINHLELPALFDINGRRPLRAQLVDTAEFWTFSNHSAPRVSADLLASVFGIDADAADFDPSVASRLFHEEADMDLVKARSERKALLYAQLMLRFRGQGVIDSSRLIRKD